MAPENPPPEVPGPRDLRLPVVGLIWDSDYAQEVHGIREISSILTEISRRVKVAG